MQRSVRRLVISLVLAAALLGGVSFVYPHLIYAQTTTTTTDVGAQRAALQAQLDQLNTQIASTQATLTTLHGSHTSLQNSIDILTAQIKKAQLELQATQVQIQALKSNIVIHSNTITTLSGKLDDEQQSLAQIIRQTNEIDQYSLVEVVLSSEDVSSFFSDLDSFEAIKQELGSSYTQITSTVSSTEDEKNQLEDQQTQAQQLAQEQTLEEQQIKTAQAQKQTLLKQTESQETTYQSIYNVQKQSIAQIQAALFALAGGSGQIQLPAAIALAKTAGAATGVSPALILGILKQETNLGANVGQCIVTNSPSKGDGINKKTGAPVSGIMKPTRDVDPFLAITTALGIDPSSQAVSCPPPYGYGGAMGPAQFIPSTWVLYEDRIPKAAGHPGTPANPWNNLDAFTATALLMSDNGANSAKPSGCPSSDCEAALRYFAGWGNADNPAYAFYGDDVMAFAAQFQSDIDTLGGS